MKKLTSITRNTGRCTELKFEWLGWQEKLATSLCWGTQIGICHQDQRYQWCEPKGSKGVAAYSSPSDLPRQLCKVQQGFNQHAENCRNIYCMRCYPNLKSINEPIYKYGYGKISKERMALTGNMMLNLLANMASSTCRIWFIRSILLENVSNKQTTSYGPSNCLLHEVEWRKGPPML